MKKYQLNKGVIEGILGLCGDEGVFRKDFPGSLIDKKVIENMEDQ